MRSVSLKSTILICGLIVTTALSADISGIGFAQTNKEAKKEALGDLSQVIKSEVRSNFESTTTDKSQNSKSNIKISSNLPILGADFSFIDRTLEVEAKVNLSPAKVNALYTKRLQNLNAEISTIMKEIKDSKSSTLKLQLYGDAYSLLKEYDRYESVAVAEFGSVFRNVLKSKLKTVKSPRDAEYLLVGEYILTKIYKQHQKI